MQRLSGQQSNNAVLVEFSYKYARLCRHLLLCVHRQGFDVHPRSWPASWPNIRSRNPLFLLLLHLAFMILLLLLFHLKTIIPLHLFLPVFFFRLVCDDEFTQITFVNVFEFMISLSRESCASKHAGAAARQGKRRRKPHIVTRLDHQHSASNSLRLCSFPLSISSKHFAFCFSFSSAKDFERTRPINFFFLCAASEKVFQFLDPKIKRGRFSIELIENCGNN